jgi:rhamnosyltransferase subunit B
VTVVTNEYFEPVVREAGLEFTAIGTREAYLSLQSNQDIWHPLKGFKFLLKDAFLPLVRPVYDLLSGFNPKETVVISSFYTFGARVAHEKWKFPFVSVHLQPACFTSAHKPAAGTPMPEWLPVWSKRLILNSLEKMFIDPMVAPTINPLLAELGLPKARRFLGSWAHSPQKIIGLFPDWFAEPQPDWPSQTELAGFYSYDRKGQKPLAKEILQFLDTGDPPIVFTPGTANTHGNDFFKASIEVSCLLGKRALLLTSHRTALPDHLPEGVVHCDYLPFSTVLPRAAAIVHHGGIGTAAQGMAAGVPQLVVPRAFDQPDNGARLERLGIGTSLPPARYRTQAAQKLDHLLASRQVKESCALISSKIDFQRALDAACLTIEQMI